MRRTCRMERKSAIPSSGSVVTTTTAAKVACGNRLMRGDRNSSVATTIATVTSADTWVRAPAREFTAVWENPPARGEALEQAPRQIGRTQREQFPVRRGRRLLVAGERTAGSDRLGEGHERDSKGAGP